MIKNISNILLIKNSLIYQNDLIRPFVDAFFLNPSKDSRFQLFKKYFFAKEDFLKENASYVQKNFYVFVGYRFLKRKYRPMFLSFSEDNKDEYQITGFSTLINSDPLFNCYITLDGFDNLNFKITCMRNLFDDSLYDNLTQISKETEKHNEAVRRKINKR